MHSVVDAAMRVAATDATVVVRGETGTGKELIASLLHVHSSRANRPLVVFNCAAIPAQLTEAHLFGHTKGAFTGATAAHDGFFVQAERGTLFIDEIGELPLELQAKLLRALQEREISPLGSSKIRKVDVRVVAATHRHLEDEVRSGRFREDLYYRLNVIELVVPRRGLRCCASSSVSIADRGELVAHMNFVDIGLTHRRATKSRARRAHRPIAAINKVVWKPRDWS